MIFKAAVFVLLALVAATAFAIVEKKTYVVHMDRTKVATSNHQQWYEDLMNSVHKLSIEEEEEETTPPELIYIYQNAISGFAAKLSAKQLESLERTDGFLFATADKMLSAHTTHTPQFLGLQFNKGLWSDSNLASDVVIGVVDTGIWPEHISFQDSGMSAVPSRWKGTCENGTMFSPSNCNKKLIGARFFYKGYEATLGRINETADHEYLSPRDANGHGTHVASTAGGNVVNNANLFGFASGSASGMMYTSRISVYKVLWGKGQGFPSDILTGIDQAVADGVDVISLSIEGSPAPYYLDGTSIASFRAMQNGIPVVCSAGNAGPYPYTIVNTAPWIFTIAASYLDRSFPAIVELGNGLTFEGSSVNKGYSTKQLRLVHRETAGGTNAEYCIPGSLHKELVENKIVVCEQPSISIARNLKVEVVTSTGEVVKSAGGVGMILINDRAKGEELTAVVDVLPTTSLGVSAGDAIIKYVSSSKNATASIVSKGTVYGTRAPMMAAFSSRGPNLVGADVIKPDVTAPGVNILAAWPPSIGPSRLESDKRSVMFNLADGTSMSCPHVSGLVALLKSVHKDWSPAAIKSALMTTAYTKDNKKAPIIDVASNNSTPATPFHFGSGHVNPKAAADPGIIYDITPEDYVIYLCSLQYTPSQIGAVIGIPLVCPENLSLQPGDLNYPSFAVNFEGKPNMSVTYTRTVTNVGTPKSIYFVHIEEPNGVAVMVQPKILKFEKMGQKLSYKVSFVGYERRSDVENLNATFGSLTWVSRKYAARSPIAVTWDVAQLY